MILIKYHALFVIFEKAAKFEIVFRCKLLVALYGLRKENLLLFKDWSFKWNLLILVISK